MAFKKAKSTEFGLFWNCLPEIKWFGHFFGLFWKLNKIAPFKACFGKSKQKSPYFIKILKICLVILPKFHQQFCLSLAFLCFWGFGLFHFFVSGNLLKTEFCDNRRGGSKHWTSPYTIQRKNQPSTTYLCRPYFFVKLFSIIIII